MIVKSSNVLASFSKDQKIEMALIVSIFFSKIIAFAAYSWLYNQNYVINWAAGSLNKHKGIELTSCIFELIYFRWFEGLVVDLIHLSPTLNVLSILFLWFNEQDGQLPPVYFAPSHFDKSVFLKERVFFSKYFVSSL